MWIPLSSFPHPFHSRHRLIAHPASILPSSGMAPWFFFGNLLGHVDCLDLTHPTDPWASPWSRPDQAEYSIPLAILIGSSIAMGPSLAQLTILGAFAGIPGKHFAFFARIASLKNVRLDCWGPPLPSYGESLPLYRKAEWWVGERCVLLKLLELLDPAMPDLCSLWMRLSSISYVFLFLWTVIHILYWFF